MRTKKHLLKDKEGIIIGSFSLLDKWIDFAYLSDPESRLDSNTLSLYREYKSIEKLAFEGVNTSELVGNLLDKLAKAENQQPQRKWTETRTVRGQSYLIERWRDVETGKKCSRYLGKVTL